LPLNSLADWNHNDPDFDGHGLVDELNTDSWMPEPMVEEPGEIDTSKRPATNTRRRRDYTKQEKDSFEKWITVNPKPERSQKVAYARLHGLTESQLQNLINNRRRRKATCEAKEQSFSVAISQAMFDGKQKALPDFESSQNIRGSPPHKKAKKRRLEHVEAPNIDEMEILELAGSAEDDSSSLPVSNSQFLQVLREKPSYSSIEEYLKSPEEAVPFESIRRASAESHRPSQLDISPPARTPPLSQLDDKQPRNFESENRPTPPNVYVSPPGEASRGFLAVPGLRSRQNSLESDDGFDATSSFGSNGTLAMSYASSQYAKSYDSSISFNSRTRTKRNRRQRHAQKQVRSFTCRFCMLCFRTRDEMVQHETNRHCLPQTFPCTWCKEVFSSTETWQDHENELHSQLEMTWFCMLDGQVDAQHCLFCGELSPSRQHYDEAHDLQPCEMDLEARTFSTRHEVMRHLIDFHDLTEHEVSFIKEDLDIWSLKLNMAARSGLWRCGYCGEVGADWDHRMLHIKSHWEIGGPRMSKIHPWLEDRACLDGLAPQYLEMLDTGQVIKKTMLNLHFQGLDAYKAAMQHRSRTPWVSNHEPIGVKPDLVENTRTPTSTKGFTFSFLSHLATRTKMMISRSRRQENKKFGTYHSNKPI